MKVFRAVTLCLVVAVGLAAVPAALAEDIFAPRRPVTIAEQSGWLDGFLKSVAGWLAWDEIRLSFGADDPRGTVAAAKQSKSDGGGLGAGTMTGNCDEGSGMDPVGAPCPR